MTSTREPVTPPKTTYAAMGDETKCGQDDPGDHPRHGHPQAGEVPGYQG